MLTTAQAAEYLGVHVETIRRLARQDTIPCFKVGRSWRFSEVALQHWSETPQMRAGVPHILAIDDEEAINSLIRSIFLKEGYRVTTFNEGRGALELIRRDRPDVVLLDLKMPGMDGPTVLREIRRIADDLPVIVITGYPDGDLMMEAMRHSPILVLPKPFEPSQLIKAVELIFGGSRPKSILWERA